MSAQPEFDFSKCDPEDVSERIERAVIEALPKLNPKERSVLEIIRGGNVTQKRIARSDRYLGCHEIHERDKVRSADESTLRQVRQIIRDLRLVHKIPILSDTDGYWIPKTANECRSYLERKAREAKAAAEAHRETVESMRHTLGHLLT